MTLWRREKLNIKFISSLTAFTSFRSIALFLCDVLFFPAGVSALQIFIPFKIHVILTLLEDQRSSISNSRIKFLLLAHSRYQCKCKVLPLMFFLRLMIPLPSIFMKIVYSRKRKLNAREMRFACL